MTTQEVFDKLSKEFNDKYVWIISFYKENGGITISDSHSSDEVHVKNNYEFSKYISQYDLYFNFKVNRDNLQFIINNVSHFLLYGESLYYELENDKTIWICTRNYEM